MNRTKRIVTYADVTIPLYTFAIVMIGGDKNVTKIMNSRKISVLLKLDFKLSYL